MQTRILILAAALFALCAGAQAAGSSSSPFQFVDRFDAERELAGLAQFDTTAEIYIWADRYVYQAGEQLTLRWTVRPNADLFPYTIVAYRINNQTGVKTFLPGGNADATDIFGNTPAQGFRIARLQEASKQVLIGSGGVFPATAGAIPNEPGMHTLVVEIRDYTGARVIKAAYFKISVVTAIEDLTGNVTSNLSLVNTKAYRLRGLLIVKGGATLNIEPGTVIIGQPGSQPPSAILITQDGKLNAPGTRARPIIMTSSQPFGQRKAGDWGGLVLLGKGPTNWPTGFGNIEGLAGTEDTRYGGADPNHSCGVMTYLRVEFAGAEFQPNEEVNSITWGGCGKGTVANHLQATYGLDDNFEWFGGNMDAKYLVSTYAADDHFDWQIGFTGRLQYLLAVAGPDFSNRGIEADNNESNFSLTPVSRPSVYNATIVGNPAGTRDEGTSVAGVWLRRGTAGSLNNLLVTNWHQNGFEVRDQATLDRVADNTLTLNGILLWGNGSNANKANTIAGQTTATSLPWLSGQSGVARNVLAVNPMLRRLAGSDPDFLPVPGSPGRRILRSVRAVHRRLWSHRLDRGMDKLPGRTGSSVNGAGVSWTQNPDWAKAQSGFLHFQ